MKAFKRRVESKLGGEGEGGGRKEEKQPEAE